MLVLSIIIPVYNVSKYLEKCFDSLLCQDLRPEEYEIVIVNDGSTDNSEEIAKRYAEKYSNVHLLTQPNGGLSAARNTGIRHAQGKYIQFVDSDDYLEPHVLGALVQKMEKEQLDVLRFNYQNVNEQYHVFEPYKAMKPFVDYRDEVCDGLTFLTERLGYGCYAVQFIIRAELLLKPENQFKKGIYFEDVEWTPRILVQATKITSVDTIVYNYLMRVGSITQSVVDEKKRKVLDDLLLSLDSINDLVSQKPELAKWGKRFIAKTHINYLRYLTFNLFSMRKFYIHALNKKNCRPLSSDQCEGSLLTIINISPTLFVWIVKLKNRFK